MGGGLDRKSPNHPVTLGISPMQKWPETGVEGLSLGGGGGLNQESQVLMDGGGGGAIPGPRGCWVGLDLDLKAA